MEVAGADVMRCMHMTTDYSIYILRNILYVHNLSQPIDVP